MKQTGESQDLSTLQFTAAMIVIVIVVFVGYILLRPYYTQEPTPYPPAPHEYATAAIEVLDNMEILLRTDEDADYSVFIVKGDDGYRITVRHPAHEEPIKLLDANVFEMSWTTHVGEIFLQRDQFTWWLRYPEEWELVSSKMQDGSVEEG